VKPDPYVSKLQKYVKLMLMFEVERFIANLTYFTVKCDAPLVIRINDLGQWFLTGGARTP